MARGRTPGAGRMAGPATAHLAELLAAGAQVGGVAIAAVTALGPAGSVVAVGRFRADGPTMGRAELGLLVEDDYQHRGLGRLLLEQLVAAARRRGVRVLDGYVEYGNAGMLHLLRPSGLPIH